MKLTIRRILCPTDFSKHSEHALRYATAFCATHQAELILLHVLEPLPATLPVDTLGTDAIMP